jgi:hypothetical protein
MATSDERLEAIAAKLHEDLSFAAPEMKRAKLLKRLREAMALGGETASEEIAAWQTASMLIGGSGDPSDVTPDQAQQYVVELQHVARYAAAYLEGQGGPGEDEARQRLCDTLAQAHRTDEGTRGPGPKPEWIKPGVRVDFRSLIGGPVTLANTVVTHGPVVMCDHWSAWIEGQSGSVSCAALTPAAAVSR